MTFWNALKAWWQAITHHTPNQEPVIQQPATPPPTKPVPQLIKPPTRYPQQEENYLNARIRAGRDSEIKAAVERAEAHFATYLSLQQKTGVPWFVVAGIHHMESGADFSTHLHNGDSLKARTYNVPAGRPKNGNPPFAFEESALDALAYDGATTWKDWSCGGCLEFCEKFNGLGYRKHGVPSAYLWSKTTVYTKGRYISDGVWDANSVSDQVGIAAVWKGLEEKGHILFVPPTKATTGLLAQL